MNGWPNCAPGRQNTDRLPGFSCFGIQLALTCDDELRLHSISTGQDECLKSCRHQALSPFGEGISDGW